MQVVLFIIGLLLLLLGASGVVDSAVAIARKIRISPLVVGITVVGVGTSLPEFTVSVFGGLDHALHLALGNIVGSNIANIGLILGISVLFDGIRVGTGKTQKNNLIYLALSIIIFSILFAGQLNLYTGLIAIAVGVIVLIWQVRAGLKGEHEDDLQLMQKMTKTTKNTPLLLCLFFISLAFLIIGGKLLVDNGVVLATMFHMPESIIGITIVAIGTSLPELAVSLIGIIKHQEKLVVGNILGSNIYNILFGGGILGLYGVGSLDNDITLLFFLAMSLLFSSAIYLFNGKELPKFVGGVFLVFYVSYLVVIFI